jgi:hypothetical protein
MNNLVNYKAHIDITNKPITFEDLDMSLFILSSRSFVDLVAKDFAKNYDHSLKIYQNDMGFFEQAKKVLNSTGEKRIYLKYNKIDKEGDNYYLNTHIEPLPVSFGYGIDNTERLQKAFNMVKGVTLQRLYRNNYAKHCISKVIVEGEEVNENPDGEANIGLCVIMLEHDKDVNTVINS